MLRRLGIDVPDTRAWRLEQMRDVQLTMNRHDVASLDELMPRFGLTAFAVELGVTSATVNSASTRPNSFSSP